MSSVPLVSVIIPAHDAERFLADAVASVLRQSWRNVEAIVVNDGSSDGTAAVADRLAASDPRVRVVHKANGGPSSARNAGLAIAGGEFLCFLDADDALLPDKIERQLAFLRDTPLCDLVFSDYYLGDAALEPVLLASTRPPAIPMRELLVYRNWFGCMAPLMRARLHARVGLFDESLGASEDWDYWIRASRCGVFSYLPGPVAIYRTHPGQMHNDPQHMDRNSSMAIMKNFERGSRDWRVARAAADWYHAKQRWARGEYARMAAGMLACVLHARSLRTLRNVIAVMR
jgi:glycosyltransferase involved in cell wall biosynthesis